MTWWQTAGSTLLGVVAGGAITLFVQIALLGKRAAIDRTDRLRTVLGRVKALYLDINPDSIAMSIGPHTQDQILEAESRWRDIRSELLGTALLDTDDAVREALDQVAIDISGTLHFEKWLVADYLAGKSAGSEMRQSAKEHFVEVQPNLNLVAERIRGK